MTHIFKVIFKYYEITPKRVHLGLAEDDADWVTVFHTLISNSILIAYTRRRLEAFAHQTKMR